MKKLDTGYKGRFRIKYFLCLLSYFVTLRKLCIPFSIMMKRNLVLHRLIFGKEGKMSQKLLTNCRTYFYCFDYKLVKNYDEVLLYIWVKLTKY